MLFILIVIVKKLWSITFQLCKIHKKAGKTNTVFAIKFMLILITKKEGAEKKWLSLIFSMFVVKRSDHLYYHPCDPDCFIWESQSKWSLDHHRRMSRKKGTLLDWRSRNAYARQSRQGRVASLSFRSFSRTNFKRSTRSTSTFRSKTS